MHISLSAPTLLIILVVVLVLGLFLRILLALRHRHRTGTRPTRKRGRTGLRTRSGRPDHGAQVAHRHGHARSPEWSRVEKEHLLREPACVACGYKGRGIQVHHIKPFHLHPNLELDPNNLITLCEIKERDHHLLIGHLDDWESYNPNVRTDVKRYYKESALKIRANPAWQKEMLRRPS